ncbi:MAG: DNA topoisomerase III, partial [Clostridia bacterium]|nr:DNA topoisomerase III [Clostridia bacterium]
MKPSENYDGLYRSAKSRALADWLVGMNASRAFTIRFHVLLSVGRVQTPTLAILVKRAKEIADFKPEEYYTLTASLGDFQALWFDPSAKDEKTAARIKDEQTAKEKAQRVKGKTASVLEVKHEDKREIAPQLFDLTSLQREANQKLGFTADKTLRLTQELYEKWKAVTYPRTDSKYLPMDMLPRLKTTLERLPAPYKALADGIEKKDGKLPISKRIFDNSKVSDHHAIIPTPQTAKLDAMPPDAAKVFDLIARRTVAAFYPPFCYDAARVVLQAEREHFKATGRVVKEAGWKAVYAFDQESGGKKKTDKEAEDKALPEMAVGDTRKVEKTSVKKDATKPPAPHTDASLLYAMENAGRDLDDEALREQMKGSGLGTPATRAAMIERLLQVGYAKRRGKAIEATEKGIQLISIAPPEIASPETTGRWEQALQEIAENKRDTERFMQGIRKLSEFLVSYALTTDKEAHFAPEERKKGAGRAKSVQLIDALCPLCQQKVQETDKAFGCSDWKNGCRFTLWKDCLKRGGGPALTRKICERLLKEGSLQGSTG